MANEVSALLKRYQRRLVRAAAQESELRQKKDSLSDAGNWDLGYYTAVAATYDAVISDLSDISAEPETTTIEDGVTVCCGYDFGMDQFDPDIRFCPKCGKKIIK